MTGITAFTNKPSSLFWNRLPILFVLLALALQSRAGVKTAEREHAEARQDAGREESKP